MKNLNFTKIIKNSALIIFFSISQLSAMEGVPEERQVLELVKLYKALSKNYIRILETLSMPSPPMKMEDFLRYGQATLNQQQGSREEDLQKYLTGLPKKMAETINQKIGAAQQLHLLKTIVSKMGITQKSLEEQQATSLEFMKEICIMRVETLFLFFQELYPALLPGTFEEFWNNDNN